MAIWLHMHNATIYAREHPAQLEQVEHLGEYIIADEACVNQEQTHEQYDVSPTSIPHMQNTLTRYQRGDVH